MKVQLKNTILTLKISGDLIYQASLEPLTEFSEDFTNSLLNKNIHDLFILKDYSLKKEHLFFYELFLKAYANYSGLMFLEKVFCLCFSHLKLSHFSLEEFKKKQQSLQCFTCDPKTFVHNHSFLCRCFKKTKEEILHEIQKKGYISLEELKDHFQVGSKCGSCQKDLKKLLFDDFFLLNKSKVEWYLILQEALEEFFFQSSYAFEIIRLEGINLYVKITPSFPAKERLESHLRSVVSFPLQCIFI